MTINEKEAFIKSLISVVERDILGHVKDMPEGWDGHELRRYIADKFEDACIGVLRRGQVRAHRATKRLADYRNEVYTRNL